MPSDVVDPSVLEALLQSTDREFVEELIEAYLEDSPGLIAGLRQALASGNATEFTRAAHSLKSSSASLGANGLSALAKELELMGKESALAGAEAKLEQLGELFERVEGALRDFRNGP